MAKVAVQLVTSIKARIIAARAIMPIVDIERFAESLGKLLFEGEKGI